MSNLPTTYTRAYSKALTATENLMKAERTKIPSVIKDARQRLEEAKAELARVQSKMRKPNENNP